MKPLFILEMRSHEPLRLRARQQSEQWSWSASTQQLLRFYEIAIHTPRQQKPPYANAAWMLAVKRAAVGGMKIFWS